MPYAQPLVDAGPQPAPPPVFGSHALGHRGVLASVVASPATIAVWQRALPAWLAAPLAAYAGAGVEAHEARVDAARIGADTDLWDPWLQHLEEPARRWLADDLSSLLSELAQLSGAPASKVLFGPIRDDRCRKLHHDHVQLRLVCTYLGPGTEWVPEEHVDRDALARPWCCVDDANAATAPRHHVRHARAGDVVLLKGADHPTASGRGAIHRSPPLEGRARVVLIATALTR